MTKSTVKPAAALEAVAEPVADAVAQPVVEAPAEPALPLYVDDTERHTPVAPTAENSVELGTGVTQVNYI